MTKTRTSSTPWIQRLDEAVEKGYKPRTVIPRHLYIFLGLFVCSGGSLIASAADAVSLKELNGKLYYVVWYEGDIPVTQGCFRIDDKALNEYSKFKCKGDRDRSFSDWSCDGRHAWEGKVQEIHLMIQKGNSEKTCKQKQKDYVDAFS